MPTAASLLRRAVDLLPPDEPDRIEMLPDLGEALFSMGQSDLARSTFDDAKGSAMRIGDDRLVARADIGLTMVEQFSGSAAAESPLHRALRGMRTLEEYGDELGIAHAWRLIGNIHMSAGRYDEAASAAEQSILHAESVGDERLVLRGIALYASMSALGPTPVGEAIERCGRIAARARDDRRTEAIVAGSLAPLYAMQGSFDEARVHYRRERDLLVELGPSHMASSTAIEGAKVELLAGDLQAAEELLRRDYAELEALDETYYRSTIAGLLARTLFLQGDLFGADRFSQIALDLADEDDVDAQVRSRSVQARILAERLDDRALPIAERLVEQTTGTADLELRGDAMVDLAEILSTLRGWESAEPPLREALRLYEQKGDVVSSEHVTRRLHGIRI
jgi:tetratricopeptide (TPR) repeat protein